MKEGRYNSKNIINTARYLQNRINGMNKKESAKAANYAPSVQNKPTEIENTANFQRLQNQLLGKNTQLMVQLMTDVQDSADDIERQKGKSLILHRLAQIQKILTPTVRVKERIDNKGEKRRTIWMEGLQQSNNLTQESNNVVETDAKTTESTTNNE